MTNDRKRPLSVEIPADLWARLESEAQALGITIHQHASAIVSRALRDAHNAEADA